MKPKKGQEVKWVGHERSGLTERGTGVGVVIEETWQNGCYVKWPNGYEEPCRHGNLQVVTK